MTPPKYVAQIENIYFLARIGSTLRWATDDIAREELPDGIRDLLRQLEHVDATAKALKDGTGNDRQ